MRKDEILKLCTLSRNEQIVQLSMHDILNTEPVNCMKCHIRRESLADCAFRLRGGWIACNNRKGCFNDILRKLPVWGTETCVACEAEPIHWIQAALLAKLESEVNDEC